MSLPLALLLLAQSATGAVPFDPFIDANVAPVGAPEMDASALPPPRPPLRRAADLTERFARGGGELTSREGWTPSTPWPAVTLTPLPWRRSGPRWDRMRLAAWALGRDTESAIGFALGPGERWCSAPAAVGSGGRLRFQAFALDDSHAQLSVSLSGRSAFEGPAPPPGHIDEGEQQDLAVPEGATSVCFGATAGSVLITEARLLEGDPEPSARPRWLVLAVVDALRPDVSELPEVMPVVAALGAGGRRYANAYSPGCHTRAATWPILSGRDPMRISPYLRRRVFPLSDPDEQIWARPNLPLTQLVEEVGYHPVFLGNNEYVKERPVFARYSGWNDPATGTEDTVARLPALMRRYADERVMLVFWISAAHAGSATPARLAERLGCSEDRDADPLGRARCLYRARAAHADEAADALVRALRATGLAETSLLVLTADHGELQGGEWPREGVFPVFQYGAQYDGFARFDTGHGSGCLQDEMRVPLVLSGPGIDPAVEARPVSLLDLYPTLAAAAGARVTHAIDGVPLDRPPAPGPPRRFVAYGFCSDSFVEGSLQYIWWSQGCRLRKMGGGEELHFTQELWRDGRLVATDEDAPERLRPLNVSHVDWIRDRLPGPALLLEGVPSPRLVVRVEVEEGARIVDWGPSATVYGLSAVESAEVDAAGRSLTLTLRGFEGRYAVATRPPDARFRVTAQAEGEEALVTFVGPRQLPLEALGQWIDPAREASLLDADTAVAERRSERPYLRLWRQAWGTGELERSQRQADEVDRILREWGYVR